MFTGLIEAQGEVMSHQKGNLGQSLVVEAPFSDVQIGESIAVNGVCLTVAAIVAQQLVFDVSPETLKLTTLGELCPHERVNLERALFANGRLGGHYVSGHVDATTFIRSMAPAHDCIEIIFGKFAESFLKYLLPKGSITLDGVSLTINAVVDGYIHVMVVPHTLAITTFGSKQVGQRVNIEFDYLTRIVAHQLGFIEVKA